MPRAPIEHDLKCWPPYYEAVETNRKNFECRWNDRGYQVGDVLRLREWNKVAYEAMVKTLVAGGKPKAEAEAEASERAYTDRECRRVVGYILYGVADPVLGDMETAHAGVTAGWVVLSLMPEVVERRDWSAPLVKGAADD